MTIHGFMNEPVDFMSERANIWNVIDKVNITLKHVSCS